MAASTTNLVVLVLPHSYSSKTSTTPFSTTLIRNKRTPFNYAAYARALTISATAADEKVVITRRSGNYGTPRWSFDFIQSLDTGYSAEKFRKRGDELKEKVNAILVEELLLDDEETNMKLGVVDCLELVDNLERLGVGYHFEPQIHRLLNNIFNRRKHGDDDEVKDLYAAALEFRVLRQNGFHVPQDIFDPFMNEEGEFDERLSKDTKGLLSLYEACFLSLEAETKLDTAREFSTQNLIKNQTKIDLQPNQWLSSLVQHALEIPLRWRVPRIEARWYIESYETCPKMNPILLEFAKLDFNIVQAVHQQDLKAVARLPFVRDRIVENFFWTIGVAPEPQHGLCRRILAKCFVLICMIDDLYDVYGSINELELFTDAVDRWDVKAIDQLPNYMRVAYLGFFNSINEMAYEAMNQQDVHVIKHFQRVWANLCKGYMKEARWYYGGYTPGVEEYLENAWVTISNPVMLMHVYAAITDSINTEAMDCLDTHDIVRWSGMLVRLVNDLGTGPEEMKRGDVDKLVQCYVKETGCTEEEARENVWGLYRQTWKKMNKECMVKESPLFSNSFVRASKNYGGMTLVLYKYGDGHGVHSNPHTTDRILSSIFNPIPLSY
ncbi:OLC1v1014974C1 [Oldenlandia corymbosa var. corymbosa]|uniref:myrcene synthase n=1 Tax=Oldenlandia corymbosa var. corymbosa TaxID=529605 RepID=A0AAV1E2X9_OLDCO|nr:OLC1v1014974C1 [Oldenlandia corymbosa var. corymbosa]